MKCHICYRDLKGFSGLQKHFRKSWKIHKPYLWQLSFPHDSMRIRTHIEAGDISFNCNSFLVRIVTVKRMLPRSSEFLYLKISIAQYKIAITKLKNFWKRFIQIDFSTRIYTCQYSSQVYIVKWARVISKLNFIWMSENLFIRV